MRTTSEIVNYLTRHYQQKTGEIAEGLLPEQITDLIQQMGEFLAKRLEEDTPYQVVWDAFKKNPEENATSISGTLEALFEAQPAVRERVDGFMQAVTALEAEQSDQEYIKRNIEDKLQSEPGPIPEEGETADLIADRKTEKNPPAFLYGNERQGFEADSEAPVSKDFMVGKNAQIINIPNEEMQFPFMFMHLGQLTENSQDLSLQQKQKVQNNLEEIRFELTRKRPFDEEKMAKAFEDIWEVAPSYANTLIESLKNHIEELPDEFQSFIIQLHSPIH